MNRIELCEAQREIDAKTKDRGEVKPWSSGVRCYNLAQFYQQSSNAMGNDLRAAQKGPVSREWAANTFFFFFFLYGGYLISGVKKSAITLL